MKNVFFRVLVIVPSFLLSILLLRGLFAVGGELLGSPWVVAGLGCLAAAAAIYPAQGIDLLRKLKALMTEVK